MDLRAKGVRAGWSSTLLFWHKRGLNVELFLSTVVERGLTGLGAFVLSQSEHARLDTAVVR
eukprot:1742311-Pyramimonas_sp.AAC.2